MKNIIIWHVLKKKVKFRAAEELEAVFETYDIASVGFTLTYIGQISLYMLYTYNIIIDINNNAFDINFKESGLDRFRTVRF